MKKTFTSLFGSRNSRLLKSLRKTVAAIRNYEADFATLDDDAFSQKTAEYRQRIEEEGERLASVLPEAFALVSEASFRVLGMRPYDVQLMGGILLHDGKVAEMATGEGKTLTATLPAYLHALTGESSQIVTVNDYLALRDAQTMKPLFDFLGLSTGIVISGLTTALRQQSYAMDVTYVTNSELGFDYLRDNMAYNPVQRVQRGFGFAIVDEVDSILIDEARTPLIISGPTEDNSALYQQIRVATKDFKGIAVNNNESDLDLSALHFTLNEKEKTTQLTERGYEELEAFFMAEGILPEGESLYDAGNVVLTHYVNAALKAEHLYEKDVDYMIQDEQVVIIDENTGRAMSGRRWGEGLHQAVEVKEGLAVQAESQTLASITYQNLFKQFEILSGMTGTADTEAFELHSVYGLEVIVLPTHKPSARIDHDDRIFLSKEAKFKAVMADIEATVERGQPLLIGTASVDDSEYVSSLLTAQGIEHNVLNAKQHQHEADIIAEAGRPGAVTIATNMAGRGTDIVLGGRVKADPDNEGSAQEREQQQIRQAKALELGGLRVISTERNDSRRIDNQLRGRAGRQGDNGVTQFYLSFEDELMRLFASKQVMTLLDKLGIDGDDAISHPMVNKAVESAQKALEAQNFEQRKSLVEMDDVFDTQRHYVYGQRDMILGADDLSGEVASLREKIIDNLVDTYCPPNTFEETWSLKGLQTVLWDDFDMGVDLAQWLEAKPDLTQDDIKAQLLKGMTGIYAQREAQMGSETVRKVERMLLLQTQDSAWRDHLATMETLLAGIHLRSYAQKDPKQEFKREAFALFTDMLDKVNYDFISKLCYIRPKAPESEDNAEAA